MNFLTSLSRRDRWKEEYYIVKSEIDWTTRFYTYHARKWSQRADDHPEPGYAAYAHRQSAMWKRLARHSAQINAKFPAAEQEIRSAFLLKNTADPENANAVLSMYPQ